MSDIDATLEQQLKAEEEPHAGASTDLAERLQKLTSGHQFDYQRTGETAELDTAQWLFREASHASSASDPMESSVVLDQLERLGHGYLNRYSMSGAMSDLELAIEWYDEALKAALAELPKNGPHTAKQLMNVGVGYWHRYRRRGLIENLEKAVQLFQEAVDAMPSDHSDLAGHLCILGSGYHDRYSRTGAIADLEVAINWYQKAIEVVPKSHPDLPQCMSCLGLGYADRHRRTSLGLDLDRAIQWFQKAVEATPTDHPARASRLEYLGSGYQTRYSRTGVLADLDLAIRTCQNSLDATSHGRHNTVRCLETLGLGYLHRYQKTSALVDLTASIQRLHEAYLAAPVSLPHMSRLLYNLATAYMAKYDRIRLEEDRNMAIDLLEQVAVYEQSPPLDRLRSYAMLAKLHTRAGEWRFAYRPFADGISLVPLLAHRSLEIADKQYLLTETAGMASDAVAITLMMRKPFHEAIRLLELGRGIILGSLSGLRVDISDLQRKHPPIAEEYLQLRDQLNNSSPLTLEYESRLTAARSHGDERYNAAKEIERVVKNIRELPGFDRFAQGPSVDELKAVARTGGAIVILNVSEYRCDAIMLHDSRIGNLQLRKVHIGELRRRAATLGSHTVDTSLLEWLWDVIAKPVLDALSFTKSCHNLPRICWIPTGPLAKFPIHAAGYHLGGTETVLDRVISSYSSSLRSLIQTRQKNVVPVRTLIPVPEKIVLVGMPELPHAIREIAELAEHCYNSTKLKVHEPGTLHKDVLVALGDCDMFHFAGHGHTHSSDPSQSGLVLSDQKLTVSSLLDINLDSRRPFLAYLSACGTGRMKHDALLDEGLHLIAACQMAGFQHVIGTLWDVDDNLCVDVALMVYKWMQDANMSDQSVSEGLHHACRKLRDKWVLDNKNNHEAIVRTAAATEDGTAKRHSRDQEGITHDARDVLACDDSDDTTPLHWVAYVHFGS